ncbi:MAG: glutamate--cysteine ligase, partial [Myxococcales bacterium]|nr:glutamate--cysteine ligase [Myxococcales bacterium]
VELKTNGPAPALAPVADAMMDEIGAIAARLRDDNACLLPGAMHPLMLPDRDMVLWPHDNQEIYATYDRIFDCRGHGWSNLQSVHLNLPFANDDEFGRLHAAIRVVLPLLPGLAASSPFREGATTGFLDTRLDVYRTNARRIPSITGHVVPEPATTRADYERTILEPMYRDIRPHDPENILQEEWLNSRGAIARFDRNAIEIRVLDVQENPHADVAVLSLIVGVLRALVSGNLSSFESQSNLGTEGLARVFHAVTREGDRAVVSYGPMLEALGLSPRPVSVAQVWRDLAEAHTPALPSKQRRALHTILDEGPLARRMERFVGSSVTETRLLDLSRRMIDCLATGSSLGST